MFCSNFNKVSFSFVIQYIIFYFILTYFLFIFLATALSFWFFIFIFLFHELLLIVILFCYLLFVFCLFCLFIFTIRIISEFVILFIYIFELIFLSKIILSFSVRFGKFMFRFLIILFQVVADWKVGEWTTVTNFLMDILSWEDWFMKIVFPFWWFLIFIA